MLSSNPNLFGGNINRKGAMTARPTTSIDNAYSTLRKMVDLKANYLFKTINSSSYIKNRNNSEKATYTNFNGCDTQKTNSCWNQTKFGEQSSKKFCGYYLNTDRKIQTSYKIRKENQKMNRTFGCGNATSGNVDCSGEKEKSGQKTVDRYTKSACQNKRTNSNPPNKDLTNLDKSEQELNGWTPTKKDDGCKFKLVNRDQASTVKPQASTIKPPQFFNNNTNGSGINKKNCGRVFDSTNPEKKAKSAPKYNGLISNSNNRKPGYLNFN